MEALYTALVNGQPEYKEDGTYIIHPPSSLQLQAARTLKQLTEINNQNQHVIIQLQQQINQQLYEIQQLNEAINVLRNPEPIPQSNSIPAGASEQTGTDQGTESVFENKGQASSVGCSD